MVESNILPYVPKGVTSYNIDEKHLEIYVENGALIIIYSTEE